MGFRSIGRTKKIFQWGLILPVDSCLKFAKKWSYSKKCQRLRIAERESNKPDKKRSFEC